VILIKVHRRLLVPGGIGAGGHVGCQRSDFIPVRLFTANKAIKYVPACGLHRTPLSGRRLLLALCEKEAMTCEQCEKAIQPQQIKRPSDLSSAILAASEAVRLGILRYEGAGAWGEPFISIAHGAGWGDIVNNYFSCRNCGQWFNLRAETYRGSGGAFEAVAEPAGHIERDAYPT